MLRVLTRSNASSFLAIGWCRPSPPLASAHRPRLRSLAERARPTFCPAGHPERPPRDRARTDHRTPPPPASSTLTTEPFFSCLSHFEGNNSLAAVRVKVDLAGGAGVSALKAIGLIPPAVRPHLNGCLVGQDPVLACQAQRSSVLALAPRYPARRSTPPQGRAARPRSARWGCWPGS